jgi:hypothetical protein
VPSAATAILVATRGHREAHSSAAERAVSKNVRSEASHIARGGAAGLRSAHAGDLVAGDRTLLPKFRWPDSRSADR